TKGEENTFEWHPAIDDGIGIGHYKIQVATSYNFNPGSIVFDRDTNETQASFDSLEDDTQYYARVMAADKFHHDSDWSEVEWSIQDHKGPGELGLTPLMEYLPAGPVPLEWEGAEDNGSGVAYYEVLWSTDPLFVSNVHNRDHVLGQSFSIPEMTTDITWHIKVRAYDSLGNPGEEETTSTTLDSRPPTQPVIVPLETHTGGRTTTLTWSESTDALSGLDHYLIEVYTGADMVGLAFSAHTTDTEFEIPGLSDGTTYHYKVTAYDRAGNRIESAMVSSIQDNRGPDTPSFLPIDTLQPTGLFRVEWGPSSDASGEEVEYQVQWASNVVFTEDITESSWLTGTNYQVSDLPAATRAGEEVKEPLPDGEYYVRVRSRDRFDQMSSFGNAVRIIVDTTAPSVPILHELPVYSGGTSVHVSWAPSVDMAAGDMEYQVLVLENETGEPIMFTAWTMSEDIEVTGLLADMTYYFKVVSRDGLGWASEPSDAEMTTMDVNGPLVTIDNRGVFGGTDMYLKGLVKDTGCGVGKVEVSFDRGQTWKECTTVMDQWSYPMNADPSDSTEFLVRGHDKGGNIGVATSGSIDHNEPVVTILYPAESDRISGLTQITGSISDEHLSSYRVEYKRPGVEEWTAIIPEQTTSSISGILATWAPSGISGGEYILKVTGTDALDQETSKTINVTLAGAILSIDPSQLTFSNYNPLPGEKVAVMVAISNFGDSQAEDVTVKLYDDGEEIYSETGVTVPANGIITISATMKAEGKHSITARATSTLYDTGEMANGATIETMEEEMILENFGGIVGIIALILALIALILAFVLKGKKKEEAEIKEEKASEEKERPKKAVPMEMPKPQIEKPMLPESPVQEIKQPQLSTPTVAPSSAPATAPQSAPQLNAAPPMTPEQNGFMAAPAAESDKPQVNMPNN
ncbi:MAG: hypothetical protein U9R75_04955, partial [Candidatus Thermoplasmatota archaeon]|nr:hypothetical protein [Candidatus Thermoplasmatota archaeon]